MNGRGFGLIGALIPPVLMGVLTSGFLDVIFNYIFILFISFFMLNVYKHGQCSPRWGF